MSGVHQNRALVFPLGSFARESPRGGVDLRPAGLYENPFCQCPGQAAVAVFAGMEGDKSEVSYHGGVNLLPADGARHHLHWHGLIVQHAYGKGPQATGADLEQLPMPTVESFYGQGRRELGGGGHEQIHQAFHLDRRLRLAGPGRSAPWRDPVFTISKFITDLRFPLSPHIDFLTRNTAVLMKCICLTFAIFCIIRAFYILHCPAS